MRRRLPVVLAGAVVLMLVLFAGRAAAGVGDYPSPLYLAGGPSTQVGTSFQLVGSAPPATPATPPTAAAGGAGGLSGSYTYLYTVANGTGGFAASGTSNTFAPSSQAVLVGSLQTGVTVDIYRQKSGTGLFTQVAHLVANASSTYTDNVSDAVAAVSPALPQADNRIATTFSAICAISTCGYIDFSPGVAPATTGATTPPTLAASPSATPNGKGWIVDGAGGVTIPAGSWTFQVRTKNSNPNGVAHLVVGVWKVTTSGSAIAGSSTILDPNCTGVGTPAGCPGSAENGTNIVTAAATAQTIAHTVSLPLISLASGEHLYVQFWRRQTSSYSNGGPANRLATMVAYDGLGQITHPAASTFPNNPTLQTPAAAARTNSSTLTATFSDPDAGDTGTVNFQACADSACTSVTASGTSASVANGADASWTPALLADGSYYWRAQATDAAGGLSNWSATRAFTLDRVANVPTLQSPADSVRLNALPALAALFSDPDAGDTGAVSFQVCTDSLCTSVVTTGSSAPGIVSGANGSWTPVSLADGTYSWQARAADAAGNQSAWTAARTFTLDTAPPDTTIASGPAALTNSSAASLGFSASEGSSTFQCSLDGGAFNVCTSPHSYSGLADGSHSFQVKATDPAGNTDSTPASRSWTVNTVAPETTITSAPADLTRSTAAGFGFSSNASGSSFECSLDGAGFAACASSQSYSGLADGGHSFRVMATDAVGNADPSPAARYWTVDTTPPVTTITSGPVDPTNSTSASLGFSASEIGSSFQCSLDGGAFGACTSPQAYGGLADGSHSFWVEATDAAGNNDGTHAGREWTVDTTPPKTTITSGPADLANNDSANFGFGASEPNAGFECSLDGAAFTACTSPQSFTRLADDSHSFRVRASDASGNTDPTPAGFSWTVDTTPPTAPGDFAGFAAKNQVKLRWTPPAEGRPMSHYVLYVDGRSVVLNGDTVEVALGKFNPDDGRAFSVAAVDGAGNEGSRTESLVGVPSLIGLKMPDAAAALAARGLAVGRQSQAASQVASAIVVSQTPGTPAFVSSGSTVALTITKHATPRAGALLLIEVTRVRDVSCNPTGRLNLRLKLSATASVTLRFLSARGAPLASRLLGSHRAGVTNLTLSLPPSVSGPGVYRVVVTATAKSQVVSAELRLALTRGHAHFPDRPASCRRR